MAGKFGKREKIIAGVIIAIAAIAIIHLYGGFSDVATQDQEINASLAAAETEWSQMQNIPTGEALDQYVESIDRDAKEFWSIVIGADLLQDNFYDMWPEPVQPKEPSADTGMDMGTGEGMDTMNTAYADTAGGESAAISNDPMAALQKPTPMPPREIPETATDAADYAAKLTDYKRRTKIYNTIMEMNVKIADTLLLKRLERLSEMYQAYGAGQAWVGDGAALQNPLVLSFLEKGALQGKYKGREVGWGIPMQLPVDRADPPALWTALNTLYNYSQALQLLDISDPSMFANPLEANQAMFNYNQALNTYNTECVKWGLLKDRGRLYMVKRDIGFYVPELAKLHLANLVMKQNTAGPQFIGGQMLTINLLKKAFDVQLPRLDYMFYLNRQMSQLETLLILARKDGVEEVNGVRIYEHSNTLTIEESAILSEQAASRVRTTGGGPGGAFSIDGGAAANAYPSSDGGPIGTMELPPGFKPYAGKSEKTGEATRVGVFFVASNENTFKYLYDIVRSPHLFKIEDVIFESLPGGKLQVYLTVECVVIIEGLSRTADGLMEGEYPKNLMGEGTINHGKVALEAKRAEEKKRGWDEKAIKDQVIAPYQAFIDALISTATTTVEGDTSLTSESMFTTGTL